MAKLVFGMNQSLDGYVDHLEMRTGPALFRYWIEHVRDLTGSVYGRRMYEVMRYWDEDRPEWSAEQHEFAAAWRRQPKWVVSRSLKSLGPNATLVEDDIEAVIRGLKAQLVGEIAVSGPNLARSLTDLGLSQVTGRVKGRDNQLHCARVLEVRISGESANYRFPEHEELRYRAASRATPICVRPAKLKERGEVKARAPSTIRRSRSHMRS